MNSDPDVIVIGAGVVGLAAASMLQARGLSVTVVDREGPAAGASAGNAGAFAFTDILPLASPGILRKAPKWLFDPLGPLSLPPAYAPRMAPWLYRFWRACSPRNVARSAAAQTALMDLSKAELEPFMAMTGTSGMLRKDGNLEVYESRQEFEASLPGWQSRERHGIEFRHVDADEMAQLQPGIAPRFVSGTFTPGWFSVADPKLYTLALAEHVRSRGGTILRTEARYLEIGASGVALRDADGRRLGAGHIVVSAGAFSHRLARKVGDRIPLETERGYNTTLPPDAFDLRMQITFGGHGFVVTRLSTGIRVGGAVELGGLSRPPDFRRSRSMLAKAKDFLPTLRPEGGVQWMGFRPSLPDSLPIIDHAGRDSRIIYAFGHGHLGLTQSSGTARLVAEMITGQAPPIDMAPFSARRF
jgi:D-amino-acid dehydrogenase